MNTQIEKLTEIIREQQKGHEYDDVFCVGEQLLDMSAHNAAYVDILAAKIICITHSPIMLSKITFKYICLADKL